MNEEFTNKSGDYCAFTDDGIVCKNAFKNRFYPYGSIEKIGFSLGSLDITGKANGEPLAFLYVAADKQQKVRIKELISFAKSKMKNAPKTDVVEIAPKKTVEEVEAERRAKKQEEAAKVNAMMHEEIRMKCNVCGKVFCYSLADVAESESHAKWARAHSVASLFGTRMDMYGQQSQAEAEKSKVVDYTRCPSCRSTNLTRLADGEQNTPVESTGNTATSAIDEIKKYKELLDMGIITQEEFDAKKKQLLGL